MLRFWECIFHIETFTAANNLAVLSLGYKICSAIGNAKGGFPCKIFQGCRLAIDSTSWKRNIRLKNKTE